MQTQLKDEFTTSACHFVFILKCHPSQHLMTSDQKPNKWSLTRHLGTGTNNLRGFEIFFPNQVKFFFLFWNHILSHPDYVLIIWSPDIAISFWSKLHQNAVNKVTPVESQKHGVSHSVRDTATCRLDSKLPGSDKNHPNNLKWML